MRWAGLAIAVALLVIGFVAFANPMLFPAGVGERLPQLIYLVLTLLLVSGAGYGFMRIRADRARIIPAILFWAGAILLIVFLYNIFQPAA